MLQIISIYCGILILDIAKILFVQKSLCKDIIFKKIKFAIIMLMFTALCTFSSIYFSGTLKTIILYIIHAIEFKILFDLNYMKSIYVAFFYSLLLMSADLIWLFLIANIVGINRIICFNEISGSILSNLSVCAIFMVITYLLRKPLKKILNAEISNNIKIVFLSLSTLLCTIFFLYIFGKEFKIYGNAFPYFITMLILMLILLSLIKQTLENNRLVKEYDNLLEFMTTYEQEIEKQRILRHETKNEFLAIKAKLCDKQKNREIIEYIDEILKEKISVNQEKYAKFGYLPPNGIKGLCYFKAQEAEKLKIDVALNISAKIKNSSIYKLNIKNQRDLGKLLGVFLDNAIEASSNSNKKQLGIEIYVNNEKETTIIISNTYDDKINKNKIGKEKFTTKGKNRGHGLLLAKNIVNNNNIFEIKTQILNGIYVQLLTIKNTNKFSC